MAPHPTTAPPEEAAVPPGPGRAPGAATALLLLALTLLCHGRLLQLGDVYSDDNCWLLSRYATGDLDGFLGTGFYELRRIPLGIFFYLLYSLHGAIAGCAVLWRLLELTAIAGTGVLLAGLVEDAFGGPAIRALLVGAAFVAFQPDSTTPMVVNMVYPIGVGLGILSLHLTARSIRSDRILRGPLSGAVASGLLAHSLFMEGAVAYELPRLVLILALLRRRQPGDGLCAALGRAVRLAIPYWVAALPVVLYKLACKPYGIYAGVYAPSPGSLFRWETLAGLAYLLRFPKVLVAYWRMIAPDDPGPALLALATAALLAVTWWWDPPWGAPAPADPAEPLPGAPGPEAGPLPFGLALVLAPLALYTGFGRMGGPGAESSHFVAMQPGGAVVLGLLIHGAASRLARAPAGRWIAALVAAALLGLGALSTNANLSVYRAGTARERTFWRAFTARFPALPPDAVVFIDAGALDMYASLGPGETRIHPCPESIDLRIHYVLEFRLNLLYAATRDPAAFRRYRANSLTLFEDGPWRASASGAPVLPRPTHFGPEELGTDSAVVVRYEPDGSLLVNREILARHPGAAYAWLADRPPPVPGPPPPGGYPFRDAGGLWSGP